DAPGNARLSFWGDFIHSTAISAGRDVRLTLADGKTLSVQLEDWPDFDDFVTRAIRGFIGRGFVFQEIEEFVRVSRSGYFVIKADAGLGKTALAAELSRRYRAPVYIFSGSSGRTRTEHALNTLCAQLIVRYSLSYSYLPPEAGQTNDT